VDSSGRRNTLILEVLMGRPAGWMTELTGRSAMRSPGAPRHRREVEREFWRVIATGVTSEQAAVAVGVSPAVGCRWFRQRGGMPTSSLAPLSGRYLCFREREEIAILRAQGAGVRWIARELGRDPSTISRELRRNAATRCGKLDYRAWVAQWKADLVAQRPKTAKLVANERLRGYVQDRLSGEVYRRDGTVVAGPATGPWKGRGRPHRQDRRWVTGWSPEQICHRLKVDFPDDENMRISHEAIYQALYVQGRGALKRELVACLRTGRALRVPRARTRQQAWAHVTPEVLISERPAEVEDRAVPGHWEGDLIIGLQRSAIGTLVERTTRFTMLVHLPREDGYGIIARTKNGPALAGYGAVTMKNALAATISTLPEQLRRSLTWDRGKELSQHAQFKIETGIPVYFADPQSPWQRATNENTNGLLRQYFPKGTDLSRWSAEEIEAVANAINNRPRKVLGWKTPAEAFNEQLLLLQQGSVASTS
jgi:IS30 family transposase